MKKILLLLAAVVMTHLAYGQAPQLICYQAVATDASGHELVNQDIKVRLTVHKNTSNGEADWIETHNVTTDGFGLFDLFIGNGTRTGGTQTNFANISWGSTRFFLRVEMDVNNGNNFISMGVNELVSVPYALYTERANRATLADSATAANRAISAINATNATRANFADSATAANRAISAINATNATRANFADSATAANRAISAINATNATRANFADSATAANRAISAINATNATRANFADSATAANRAISAINATNATRANFADSATAANRAISAINATNAINAVSATNAALAARATIADSARIAASAADDRDKSPTNEIQTISWDSTNAVLSLSNPNGAAFTVNLSNAAFRAPGASIEYPYGLIGTPVLIPTSYTVPAGKTLFISAVDAEITLADGKVLQNRPGMPIIPENTVISNCFCSGLLVDNKPYAQPLVLDLSAAATTYTVPLGRNLIIKSGSTSGGRMDFTIDGTMYSFYTGGNQATRFVVIPGGKTISRGGTGFSSFVLTGYLLQN